MVSREETVSGIVDEVGIIPGRTSDGLITLIIKDRRLPVMVLSATDKSEITVDGEQPGPYPDIVTWIATHECEITAYPLLERYGAALKADFKSTKMTDTTEGVH